MSLGSKKTNKRFIAGYRKAVENEAYEEVADIMAAHAGDSTFCALLTQDDITNAWLPAIGSGFSDQAFRILSVVAGNKNFPENAIAASDIAKAIGENSVFSCGILDAIATDDHIMEALPEAIAQTMRFWVNAGRHDNILGLLRATERDRTLRASLNQRDVLDAYQSAVCNERYNTAAFMLEAIEGDDCLVAALVDSVSLDTVIQPTASNVARVRVLFDRVSGIVALIGLGRSNTDFMFPGSVSMDDFSPLRWDPGFGHCWEEKGCSALCGYFEAMAKGGADIPQWKSKQAAQALGELNLEALA